MKEFIGKAVEESIDIKLETVKIKREHFFKYENKKNYIDLVLSFEDLSNKTYIIGIEHKVNSHEGENQTLRYAEGLKEYSKDLLNKQIIGIYFTKWNFPIELSDKSFKHIKYSDFITYFNEIKLEELSIDSHVIISHFKRATLDKDRLKYDYFIKNYNRLYSLYEDKNNVLLENNDRILFENKTMTSESYKKAFTYYFCYTIAHYFIFKSKENIYSDLGKSSSSGKSLYQLTRKNWNFKVNDRSYTIHIEGENPNNLNLHFERSPYIPHSNLKGLELEEYNNIRYSFREEFKNLKEEFNKSSNENSSKFLSSKEPGKISILSFNIKNIENIDDFVSEISKFIESCNGIIQLVLSQGVITKEEFNYSISQDFGLA